MFDEILRRMEELERRIANTIRVGKVAEVDAAKGLVKLKTGDLVSDWVLWAENAGAIKTWSPPTVGQQMMLISPSGEPGQGWAAPGGYSTDNPAPSGDGAASVMTIGGTSITFKGDSVVIVTDTATITASTVNLGGEGGKRVARIGDATSDGAVIVEGSGTVSAVD